uniref:Uncharacterized protein n=1 Tax=mine drainage metagenome TaxID=410659 RepID=E6QL50_9ZZZZ
MSFFPDSFFLLPDMWKIDYEEN